MDIFQDALTFVKEIFCYLSIHSDNISLEFHKFPSNVNQFNHNEEFSYSQIRSLDIWIQADWT